MRLRLEALTARLGADLSPVYAIHGNEPLLASEAADAVRLAARKAGYAEREVFFAARGFDWSELRNAAASLSLFGGRKVIDLRIPTGKPGADGGTAIEAYCAKPNPDNLLLVTMPELDWKAQKSAWFAALERCGMVVEALPVERARLPDWIKTRLASNGQRASREVLEFLADRVEGNLLAAHQEVQKLALLLPPGELDPDAVRLAVANVARYDVAQLGEALLRGDLARYARVLEGLRGEGEAPTYVLWQLAEELRALARIHAGLAAGRALEALFRENRVWRNKEALVRGALKRLPRAHLQAGLARTAAIDRSIKGLDRFRGRGNPWDEFLKLGLSLTHERSA